jgi:hypothetical protein
MPDLGAIKAGGAYVAIGADSTQLEKALDRAASRMRSLSTVMNAIGRDFLKAGTVIVSPFIAAAKAYETMGNNLFRASQRTGIAVSNLSALGYAAQQSGTDMESLELAIRKMQKTVGGAAAGTREAVDALRGIGLTINDLKGSSPDEQFIKIAEALRQINDPTIMASEAMKIFGRNGTQIIPLLEEGSKGIQAMEARAKALGIVLGHDAAAGSATFHGRVVDLTDVLKNSFFRVGEAIGPMLQSFIEHVSRATIVINRFITEHKALVQIVLKVGAGIAIAGAAFLAIGAASAIAAKSISLFGAGISALRISVFGLGSTIKFAVVGSVGLLKTTFAAMVTILTGALGPIGIVGTALAGLGIYLLYTASSGKTMLTALGNYFGDLATVAKEAFGGIRDALAGGDWKLAADIAWTGLKLSWAQGIAPLKTAWVGMKEFGKNIWLELGTTIQNAMFVALAAVENVTFKTIAALQTAWANFAHFFNGITNSFGNKIAQQQEALDHDFKYKKAIDDDESSGKITHEEAEKRRLAERRRHYEAEKYIKGQGGVDTKQNDKERDEAIAQSNADLAKRTAQTNADLKDRLAQSKSDHDAEKKQIEDDSKAEIDANQAKLDALNAQLKAKAAQAKKEGGGKGLFGALPGLPPLSPFPKLPSSDDLDSIGRQIKSSGTFSARGASGLAGGGIPQRQLAAAMEANKIGTAIVNATKDVGSKITDAMTLA